MYPCPNCDPTLITLALGSFIGLKKEKQEGDQVKTDTLFLLISSYEEQIFALLALHKWQTPPGLNLKVKCVMMVKYDSTMSWQPCSEAFFRICQAVVADPMELCTEMTRQQPLHHQHGVTLSGRRALPDCRYVWNPSSFTPWTLTLFDAALDSPWDQKPAR